MHKSINNSTVNSGIIFDSFNSQNLHLQLKSEAQPLNEPQPLIERVALIFSEFNQAREKHNLWNDPLSNEIFYWMIQVMQFTSDEEFKPHREEALAELANEILVNPLRLRPSFFSSTEIDPPEIVPLEVPLLDGDWVWEKDTWLDYRATRSALSMELISFDGKPLEEKPKSHELVMAMLKLLPTSADSPTLESTSAAQVSLREKLRSYNAQGRAAILERKNKEQEENSLSVAAIVESVRKEFQEARQKERDRIDELLRQESIKSEEMNQRMKALEETLKSLTLELAEVKAQKEVFQEQVIQLTAATQTQANEITRLSSVVHQKNIEVAAVLEAARAAAAAAANSGRRKKKKRWYRF